DALVVREGRLEGGHLGAGADPAAAERIGDARDLRFADRRRAEHEEVPAGANRLAAVECQAGECGHESPEEKGLSKYPFLGTPGSRRGKIPRAGFAPEDPEIPAGRASP